MITLAMPRMFQAETERWYGFPLQVMEDVSEEHARKTITVDPFPHSSVVAASIHPCKHASVVKKLGQMAESGGKEFKVEK